MGEHPTLPVVANHVNRWGDPIGRIISVVRYDHARGVVHVVKQYGTGRAYPIRMDRITLT